MSASNKALHDQITKHLRTFREAKFKSRAAFSRASAITSAVIGNYEQHNRRLEVGEYLYLCFMFQIDPIKLLVALIDGQTVTLDELALPKAAAQQKKQVGIVAEQQVGFEDISQTMRSLLATYAKECRNAANLTMRKAATQLGISHTHIGKIEVAGRCTDIGELVCLFVTYDIVPADGLTTLIKRFNMQQAA